MWRHIIGHAIFQLGVLFFTLYGAEKLEFLKISLEEVDGDEFKYHDLKHTIVFNAFVFCQVFNEFNARKLNNGMMYISLC